MAPQSRTVTEEETIQPREVPQEKYEIQIIWRNVVLLALLHLNFLYAVYIAVTRTPLMTWIFIYGYTVTTALGVTAGAHRLWCHRSYKARLPLRIFLAICHSMAAQTDLFVWCRDHRVHHRFTDTDADPHNIKRGFFFAHCGWLMCKDHPDVVARRKEINVDDLRADPVVRFSRRFHIPLVLFFGFLIPALVPYYFFEQTPWDCLIISLGRYVIILNVVWSVDSVAHMFGDRPFDKNICASESGFLSWWAQGEGWHNYHHVFPSDYAASELGNHINTSKRFIDLMAKIGQAYDLKTTSPEAILNRKLRTGDGSRLEGDKRD